MTLKVLTISKIPLRCHLLSEDLPDPLKPECTSHSPHHCLWIWVTAPSGLCHICLTGLHRVNRAAVHDSRRNFGLPHPRASFQALGAPMDQMAVFSSVDASAQDTVSFPSSQEYPPRSLLFVKALHSRTIQGKSVSPVLHFLLPTKANI